MFATVVCVVALVIGLCGPRYNLEDEDEVFLGFKFGAPAPKELAPDKNDQLIEKLFMREPFWGCECAYVYYTKETRLLSDVELKDIPTGVDYISARDSESIEDKERVIAKAKSVLRKILKDVEYETGVKCSIERFMENEIACEMLGDYGKWIFFVSGKNEQYSISGCLTTNLRVTISVSSKRVAEFNDKIYKENRRQR